MKEILGNNLKQLFFILDNQDEEIPVCTFRNNRYEVWEVPDKLFEDISNMSEEDFEKFAGEDAWWRYDMGSVLYAFEIGEITANNQKMIGWIRKPWEEEISTDIKYSSLTEYLCEFIGASTPKNVMACVADLAKFNNMKVSELMKKYEGE